MSIGLKRGTVCLEPHQPAWEQNAAAVIAAMREALSGLDALIEHVGSTAIRSIRAKPIIDIAAAVTDFDAFTARNPALAERGIEFRSVERSAELLYAKGDLAADFITHHIHVMRTDAPEWRHYLLFRDYLNANADAAAEYEAVKIQLAAQYPDDRASYTAGKSRIIARLLREAEGQQSERSQRDAAR